MSNEQLLAVSAYNVRADSIKKEGYRVLFDYRFPDFYMTKFVHRNGNRITLHLSLKHGVLSQTTNKKEVFRSQMY